MSGDRGVRGHLGVIDLVLERMSSCASNALALAREEARLLAHPYIGTEHLLIGLAREEGGAAIRVLAELNLTADLLRDAILFIGGPGDSTSLPDEPQLSPRVERVIEAADAEAQRRNHPRIETTHLLFALVRERQGVAVMLLEVPGLRLERIGGALVRALRDGVSDAA